MNESEDLPKPFDIQNEQVCEAIKGMTMPLHGIDLSGMLPSLEDIQSPFKFDFGQSPIKFDIDSITKALLPPDFGIDFTKSLGDNVPQFHLELPPLQLDYTRLFLPALNIETLGFKNLIDSASAGIFDAIYGAQRSQFEGIFEQFTSFFDNWLPPNWRGVRDLRNIETLLLDEALALAWVPPTDILTALLNAPSKQERRRILGRRWKRVVAACRKCLESASTDDVAEYRSFALNVVELLEMGQPKGAQALAANVLDTMLRQTLDGPARREVTDQRTRFVIDELPIRAAMVFGGIWGSHTEFWQSRGDSIPRGFTRHASAHGVSRLQYSRINAVIALMHCTAYIMLLDSGDLE